jgi:hypothetical protein
VPVRSSGSAAPDLQPSSTVSGAGSRSAAPSWCRAFMRCGADHRGQLRVDQRLVDRRRRRPDPVVDIAGFQCLENLVQGPVLGPSYAWLSAEDHWRGLADRHTVAPTTRSPTPSKTPTTYTTPRDVTPASPGTAGRVSVSAWWGRNELWSTGCCWKAMRSSSPDRNRPTPR